MTAAPPAQLIAFYLPQFHPIPENDEWWGAGFTDWTNVAKARPLFRGHYQPHVPAELGYYDLRDADVRERQAELARAHGIAAFCYYHYWFGGRRLLRQPLDEVLASGRPDFPFCLCWANENWTRVWDGLSDNVLIGQTYSEDDDLQHIRWLARVFEDERYLRVDGKPLFAVYRARELPDPRATAQLWREEARRLGVGEIFLARVESFHDEHDDPTEIGFDAAIEFQPDMTNLPTPASPREGLEPAPPARPDERGVRSEQRLRLPRARRARAREAEPRVHPLPGRHSVLGQLREAEGARVDHRRLDAGAVRRLAPRGDRASAGGAAARVRQRVERVGRGQPPRAVRAVGARLPRGDAAGRCS